MKDQEKQAKGAVLKNIAKFMKTLNAEKIKPKKKKVEAKPEKEIDKEKITPEMIEKLREMYKDKDDAGEKE